MKTEHTYRIVNLDAKPTESDDGLRFYDLRRGEVNTIPDDDYVCGFHDFGGESVGNICFKNTKDRHETAQFIVRAVNSHEAMKSALEELLNNEKPVGRGDASSVAIKQMRYQAALDKARAALELAKKGSNE